MRLVWLNGVSAACAPVQAMVYVVGALIGVAFAVLTRSVTVAPRTTATVAALFTVTPSVGTTGQRPGVAWAGPVGLTLATSHIKSCGFRTPFVPPLRDPGMMWQRSALPTGMVRQYGGVPHQNIASLGPSELVIGCSPPATLHPSTRGRTFMPWMAGSFSG
jgi:hypothetical protein